MDPDPNTTPDEQTATAPGAAGPDDAAPSATWGRLVLIEEIGRGTFGRVYRAWDPALEREVALKLIALPDADPAAAAAALREGRMLARVRHPNVVTVHGADQESGQIGIWMELVRGRSFADIIRRDGPLGPEETTLAGVTLCRALAAVHAAGLLHRDIKPANVMREAGGRLVLMDFGAGRDALAPARPDGADTTGTPVCMAPEVLIGQQASAASDIYSVGALLFFLVSGHYPVGGRTLSDIVLAHSSGRRRLLVDVRPDLPERFVQVVERALSAAPGRRFQTSGAMMQELLASLPAERAPRTAEPGSPAQDELGSLDTATPVQVERTPGSRTGGGSSEPAVASSRLRRGVAVLGGTLAGVWVAGFLMTMALDVTLGRSAAFGGESPLAWFVWGLRSLVMPTVLAIALAVAVLVLASAWRLATSMSRGLHEWSERLETRAGAWLARSSLASPTGAGVVVVVLQMLALAAVWRRFQPILIGVTTTVDQGAPGALATLGPANFAEHDQYRLTLAVVVLATAVAWYGLRALARHRQSPLDRPTLIAGVGLGILAVLLFEIPYRVLFHNEFERVALESTRCYQIGERGDELLLHCPETAPPRNRVVRREDARLQRLNVIESVFTPSGAKEPR